MYACICMYVYVCMYMNVCMYVCTRMCMYVCMYVYVCVCIHVYVCMHNILGELSGGKSPTPKGRGIVRGNCPGGIVLHPMLSVVHLVMENVTVVRYKPDNSRQCM